MVEPTFWMSRESPIMIIMPLVIFNIENFLVKNFLDKEQRSNSHHNLETVNEEETDVPNFSKTIG